MHTGRPSPHAWQVMDAPACTIRRSQRHLGAATTLRALPGPSPRRKSPQPSTYLRGGPRRPAHAESEHRRPADPCAHGAWGGLPEGLPGGCRVAVLAGQAARTTGTPSRRRHGGTTSACGRTPPACGCRLHRRGRVVRAATVRQATQCVPVPDGTCQATVAGVWLCAYLRSTDAPGGAGDRRSRGGPATLDSGAPVAVTVRLVASLGRASRTPPRMRGPGAEAQRDEATRSATTTLHVAPACPPRSTHNPPRSESNCQTAASRPTCNRQRRRERQPTSPPALNRPRHPAAKDPRHGCGTLPEVCQHPRGAPTAPARVRPLCRGVPARVGPGPTRAGVSPTARAKACATDAHPNPRRGDRSATALGVVCWPFLRDECAPCEMTDALQWSRLMGRKECFVAVGECG